MSSTTRSTGCSRELPQRLLAVGGLDDRVAVALEREGEHLAHGVLVVDEQDRGGGVGHRRRLLPTVALGMSASPVSARGGGGAGAAPRLARASRQRPPLPQRASSLALAAAPDPRLQHHAARRRCRRRCCRRTSTAPATRDAGDRLLEAFPDRAPGGAGLAAAPRSGSATRWRRTACRSPPTPGRSDVPGLGRVRLHNLWAVARGQSSDAIVVMAHRDNTGVGPGANDDASGTAALVELARGYAQAGHARGRARAAGAHARLPLHRRRRLRRRSAPRASPSSCRSTSSRSSTSTRSRARAAADRDRRRHAALAGGDARRDGGEARARADRRRAPRGRASARSCSTSPSRSRSTSRGRSSRAASRRSP